ncbi:hypothetical protein QQS21_011747 [Conoideocrella luteorostrata]|uniref:cellulase n=1 Tax=Conoideocrella luteorostrata TaxID=1105319 RepID=A0AAJ0FVJ5_9HYPO|nr:hypothetical protein QQS21_011747 [Conoideocrella luteorostrata]
MTARTTPNTRTTLMTPTTPAATPAVSASGKLKYSGVWGTDFTFPNETAISTLINDGYNIFRIRFAMERLAALSLSSTLQTAYLNNLAHVVSFTTKQGRYVVLDPHNYGRYSSNIVTDTNAFKTFRGNITGAFSTSGNVIFDTHNEYHDMNQILVLHLNRAAIDGVGAVGAASQYIMASGNSYSGA